MNLSPFFYRPAFAKHLEMEDTWIRKSPVAIKHHTGNYGINMFAKSWETSMDTSGAVVFARVYPVPHVAEYFGLQAPQFTNRSSICLWTQIHLAGEHDQSWGNPSLCRGPSSFKNGPFLDMGIPPCIDH